MTSERIEDVSSGDKRKGGRPRKHPEGNRRPTLTYRVRGDTYERLKAQAEFHERSISEEAEEIMQQHWQRMEQAEKESREMASNLADTIKMALRLAAISARAQANESPKGYDAAMAAIATVTALLTKPKGYIEPETQALALLGQGVAARGPDSRPADIEGVRAVAIGQAAGCQAVTWRKDPKAEPGDFYKTLLSGGKNHEEGYEFSAELERTVRDCVEQEAKSDKK